MPAAKRELKELQKFAKTHDRIKLEPWDVKFYEERLKKDVLGYDEEQLRPYLEMEKHAASRAFSGTSRNCSTCALRRRRIIPRL